MKNNEVLKSLVEISVEDCMNLYEQQGYSAICNDGILMGFVEEDKIPAEKLKFIWLNQSR